jgi:drug/metabolite transporter (DMT)-like permease
MVASRAMAGASVERRASARAVTARPAFGYAMVVVAATLWGINGTVTKVIMASGVSAERLTQLRCTGAAVALALLLAPRGRSAFRISAAELPMLLAFGVVGLTLVQWLYFVAIRRMEIGVALLLEYLAPLLIAFFARFVLHENVRRRIWVALGLALVGLAFVVEVWSGFGLDGLGVAAALGAALAYAAYVLLAERGVRSRDTVSLIFWGFAFSTLVWTVAQPWWSFPADSVGATVSLLGRVDDLHLPVWALVAWMLVLGTIVPFRLMIGALRHISATRAGIAAMAEPVVASVVAFAWLGESLAAGQLVGAAVVLVAIVVAQTAR